MTASASHTNASRVDISRRVRLTTGAVSGPRRRFFSAIPCLLYVSARTDHVLLYALEVPSVSRNRHFFDRSRTSRGPGPGSDIEKSVPRPADHTTRPRFASAALEARHRGSRGRQGVAPGWPRRPLEEKVEGQPRTGGQGVTRRRPPPKVRKAPPCPGPRPAVRGVPATKRPLAPTEVRWQPRNRRARGTPSARDAPGARKPRYAAGASAQDERRRGRYHAEPASDARQNRAWSAQAALRGWSISTG